MTTAQKLSVIAKNTRLIYDGQKAKYDNLNDIYTGLSDSFGLGCVDLYNELWDIFQMSGSRTDYKGMISQGSSNVPNPNSFGGWKSQHIISKYPLKPTGVYGMFAFCENLLETPAIDFSDAGTDVGSMFFKCTRLKHVPALDIPNVTRFRYMFLQCNSLETIDSINAPKVTEWTQTFMGCDSLKNIKFLSDIKANMDLHWSTLLTASSLENIVSHLSDSSTGKTLTLPIAAVGKISEALLSSKSNWDIAYA